MRCYITSFLILSTIFSTFSQNEDTPNLSFEQGNFTGWKLYTGKFYHVDAVPGTYQTDWTEVTPNAVAIRTNEQIKIMNTMGTPDPIVSCSDFLINPEGMPLVVRVGKPLASETQDNLPAMASCTYRHNNAYAAEAERMSYTFTVTEKTTLFTYRFASVLHVPNFGSNNQNHFGEEYPSFSVNIKVLDEYGNESILPCGEFNISADINAAGLKQNKNARECPSSSARTEAVEYVYKEWTTGSLNLSAHIGKTVTIDIENHDCLVRCTASQIVGGSHEAYGYFWAETRELKLNAVNCGTDDAIIKAPPGFSSYKWSRSDGNPVALLDGDPSTALIPQSTLRPNVEYFCEMKGDLAGCSPIVLSTTLNESKLTADFEFTNECSGKIIFENKSSVVKDSIRSYSWNFGDGSTSIEKNPEHIYTTPGEYDVTLNVTSYAGCETSVTRKVIVRYFPDLRIEGKQELCYGEPFILTVLEAEVGSKFLWSNGSTLQTMTATATTSQPFEVTVTDPYNCVYSKSVYVSVKPTPMLLLSGDSIICLNDTATIEAKGAQTYLWNNGNATSQIRVRPLADEIYTVYGTAANGCKTEKKVLVRVNPLPIVSIEGEKELCKNTPATIEAKGAKTYFWDDLYTGSSRTVTPLTNAVYTVTGVDSNNCSASYTHRIKVKENPILTYTGDTTICEGNYAKLVANGATNYLWHDGTASNTLFKIPSTDTVYSVEGERNGCTAQLDIPIKILSLPVFWVNGKTEVCEKDTLHLKATGAYQYRWSTGETIDSISSVPLSTTVYQLQGFGQDGCAATIEIPITVHENPTMIITGDNTVCENTSANLEVVGNALIYTWDTGTIGTEISPYISENKTFIVKGENAFGCLGTASFDVTMIPFPVLSFEGNPEVCNGSSVTLAAQGAAMYEWHDGSKTGVLTKTPTRDTIYSVIGTQNGCSSKLNIPIKILPTPNIWVEGKSVICRHETLKLQAKGAKNYQWNTGATGDVIEEVPEVSANYSVTGFGDNGCGFTLNVEVTIIPDPIINIMHTMRSGCPAMPDTVTLSAQGAKEYIWSSTPYHLGINGMTRSTIKAAIEDEVFVYVEGVDSHGCVGHDSLRVEEMEDPVMAFEVSPNWVEKENPTVRFNGIFPQHGSWYWNPGDGTSERIGHNLTHDYALIGAADSFVVSVRSVDENGCEYTGEATVYAWKDFWAPEAFSPNNDQLNDVFRFLGGESMDEFTFIIYNRLGEIVFTGNSLTDEWDGTYQGKPCPWGIYGWNVLFKSNKFGFSKSGERKGFVTIVR